ncbi:hypothetical protein HDV05_007283, partial [Chytridiales sp. JEL 0842]
KLGDRNNSVKQAAWHCINSISAACGYDATNQGVISLIVDNIDYVVNEVSQRLRYLKENPRTPLVLTAALKIAGMRIVPYLEDSIHEVMSAIDETQYDDEFLLVVLLNVLDTLLDILQTAANQNSENSRDYVGVYQPLVIDCQSKGPSLKMREFALKFSSMKESEKVDMQPQTLDEILSAEAYFKKRLDDKESDSNTETPPTTSDSDKKTPTFEESLAISVLDKLTYFLSGNSAFIRAFVIRSTAKAIPLLKHLPEKLNPLIHEIMPAAIHRLEDQEHFVVLDALSLIQAMIESGKTFTTRKVVDSLLPKFDNLLQSYIIKANQSGKSATHSLTKAGNQNWQHSARYKVLMATMETLNTLIRNVSTVQYKELRRLSASVWPYLNQTLYPVDLQYAAKALLLSIGQHDKNHIWLAAVATAGAQYVDVPQELQQSPSSKFLGALHIPKYYTAEIAQYGDPSGFKENVNWLSKSLFSTVNTPLIVL